VRVRCCIGPSRCYGCGPNRPAGFSVEVVDRDDFAGGQGVQAGALVGLVLGFVQIAGAGIAGGDLNGCPSRRDVIPHDIGWSVAPVAAR
jgi:hypothetical protein